VILPVATLGWYVAAGLARITRSSLIGVMQRLQRYARGVTYREVHDADGATRLNFRPCWRQANRNPTLQPFLDILRERYPNLMGDFGHGSPGAGASSRMPDPSR
jgi:hypothetical protein